MIGINSAQVSGLGGLWWPCLAARLIRRSNRNHTCAIQRRETQQGQESATAESTAATTAPGDTTPGVTAESAEPEPRRCSDGDIPVMQSDRGFKISWRCSQMEAEVPLAKGEAPARTQCDACIGRGPQALGRETTELHRSLDPACVGRAERQPERRLAPRHCVRIFVVTLRDRPSTRYNSL